MRRVERDARRVIASLGAEIVAIRNGGRHKVALVRGAAGRTGYITLPNSPSDARAQKNLRADIRRLVRT